VKPDIANPATASKSRCRIIAYVALCFRRRPGSGKAPLGLESILVSLGVDNWGEEPSNYHIHIENQVEKWRGSWVDDARKALLAYDWPGNVRELENCLERACAFTSGSVIQVSDLPSAIHGAPVYPSNGGNGKTQIMPMAELEKQTILRTIAQLNGDKLLAARMLGIGKTTLYRKLKEYVTQD
jgi:transcriptional regulator of acetoin/glycerol metabolism